MLGGSVLVSVRLESLGSIAMTVGFFLGLYSIFVWLTTPPAGRKAVVAAIVLVGLFVLMLIGIGYGLSRM